MYEFSLLKSLFFEMEPHKMEGVKQTKRKKSTYRRLEVHYDRVPEVYAITSEERILPYLDRYYFYINDEDYPAEIRDEKVKRVIYEFYKDRFPQYLKENVREDMGDADILDCFEVFKMPDYRPKYAFPGLITIEDLRNGNVHFDKPKYSFPGLELLGKHRDDGEPAIAELDGYTAFDGDREKAQDKIEALKKQFSPQLDELGIADLVPKEETKNV